MSRDDIGSPILVATHPRSGTHLTIDLLRKQFAECRGWLYFGETLHHLYLNLDGLSERSKQYAISDAVELLSRADRPIVKTHSRPGFQGFSGQSAQFAERVLEESTVLYVLRDLRDVICSMYNWERGIDPDLRCSLSTYLRMSPDQSLYAADDFSTSLSRVERWVQHVEEWTTRSNVNVIRYEDIVENPASVIANLSELLGLSSLDVYPLLPEKASSTSRWVDYWRRLVGNHESTAILGGKTQKHSIDWRDHLDKKDITYMYSIAGKILTNFGYKKKQLDVKNFG